MPRSALHLALFAALSGAGVAHSAQAQPRMVAEVTAPRLNVRSAPGTSSRILGSVTAGTRLAVLSTSAGWIEVSLEGMGMPVARGFVSSRLVRLVTLPADVPAAPPPVVVEPEPQPRIDDAPVPPSSFDMPTPAVAKAAEGASPRSSVQFRGSISMMPWELSSAGESVTLTSDADTSPVPSIVRYKPSRQSRAFTVSGTASFPRYIGSERLSFNPSVTLEAGFGGGLTAFRFGGGASVVARAAGGVHLTAGVTAMLGLLTGTLGEVGATAGDSYLGAPDGERYETGSTIIAESLLGSIDPAVGVELHLASLIVGLDVGYRLAGTLGDPDYKVQDGNDDGRTSKLPASGFRLNPPDVRQRGTFARIVLGVR